MIHGGTARRKIWRLGSSEARKVDELSTQRF
jgi:hypothetical protein